MRYFSILFFFLFILSTSVTHAQSSSGNDLILAFDRATEADLKQASTEILKMPGTQIMGVSVRLQIILVRLDVSVVSNKQNLIEHLRAGGLHVCEKEGSISKLLNDLPDDFSSATNLPQQQR